MRKDRFSIILVPLDFLRGVVWPTFKATESRVFVGSDLQGLLTPDSDRADGGNYLPLPYCDSRVD